MLIVMCLDHINGLIRFHLLNIGVVNDLNYVDNGWSVSSLS